MKLELRLENDEFIPLKESEYDEDMPTPTEVSDEIDDLLVIYNNLRSIKNNIKKFGITKEFLHLVNQHNSLSTILNISLPYYESDDLSEDINIENIPDVNVVVEGLNEQIKNIGNKIKEKFDKLSNSFKQTWSKFLQIFQTLEGEMTKVKNAAANSKKQYTNEELKQIKLSALPKDDLDEHWANISHALRSSQHLSIKIGSRAGEPVYDFTVPRKDMNLGLKFLGKSIENNEKGLYVVKKIGEGRDYVIKENSNAYELGYNKKFFIDFCGNTNFVKLIQVYIKDTQAILEKGREKAVSYLHKEKDAGDINLLNNNFKIVFEAYNDLIQEMIFYIRNVIALAKHFNF